MITAPSIRVDSPHDVVWHSCSWFDSSVNVMSNALAKLVPR